MSNYLLLFYISSASVLVTGCLDSTDINSDSKIIGDWINECYVIGKSRSKKSLLTITENQYISDITTYSDSSCTTVNKTFHSSWTYVIREEFITDSGLKTQKIDLHTGVYNPSSKSEFINYDIFTIIEEKLYFGQNLNFLYGDFEVSRPQALDFDFYYIKN